MRHLSLKVKQKRLEYNVNQGGEKKLKKICMILEFYSHNNLILVKKQAWYDSFTILDIGYNLNFEGDTFIIFLTTERKII